MGRPATLSANPPRTWRFRVTFMGRKARAAARALPPRRPSRSADDIGVVASGQEVRPRAGATSGPRGPDALPEAAPGHPGQARPPGRSARRALLLAAALRLLGLRFFRGLFAALRLGGAGLRRTLDRPGQELREVDDLRAASRCCAFLRRGLSGRRVASDRARLDLLVDRGED